MTKILSAGTFDNFHVGHQFFLWSAKKRASSLVVIVARDKNVKRFKGQKPKNSEKKRLARVKKEFAGIKNVEVRLGREDGNFLKVLELEKPEWLFLGYDQWFDEKVCMEKFPDMKIQRVEEYFSKFFKSSRF